MFFVNTTFKIRDIYIILMYVFLFIIVFVRVKIEYDIILDRGA